MSYTKEISNKLNNLLEKNYEVYGFIRRSSTPNTSNLKNVFVKSFTNKIAYKILENDLKNFRDQINPEKYNGATLIGLNGISVKSHGNATPYAFSCALSKCYDFVVNDLNKKIVVLHEDNKKKIYRESEKED